MKKTRTLTLASAGFLGFALQAATIEYDMTVKGPLDSPTSWVGGAVPAAADTVLMQAQISPQSLTVAAPSDLTWAGFIADASTNKDFTVKLTGTAAQNLYLGRQGLTTSAGNMKAWEITPTIRLTTDQSWLLRSGTTTAASSVYLQEHALTLATANGTKEFKGGFIGPGTIFMEGGFKVNSGSGAIDTDISLRSSTGGTAEFLGYSTVPRMKNVSQDLGYATLYLNQSTESRPVTTKIDGSLTCNSGILSVNLLAGKAFKHTLTATAYNHNGGVTLFKGTNLGTVDMATTAGQAANVIFDAAPILLGTADGLEAQTPIMKGTIADTTTAGYGMGFATYNSTYGIRLLDSTTEYTDTLESGSTALNNVRLPTTDAPIAVTLTDPMTTVNSLMLLNTGTGNDMGITISNDNALAETTLRVASGMIYAQQTVSGTPTTNDVIVLKVPLLDFSGSSGLFYLRDTKGIDNGVAKGSVNISSIFTNVAPEGVSFFGNPSSWSLVQLDGAYENTYTGRITVGRGAYLRLARSTANTAIQGQLVIDGGVVQYDHQLNDETADIIIYSGTSRLKTGAGNSGNGGAETFRNLIMYGGSHEHGGGGGGVQNNQNLYLYGGTYTIGSSGRDNVANDAVFAGTTMVLSRNTSSNRSGPILTVGNNLIISNILEDVSYVPLTVNHSLVGNANAVTLSNRLTFAGNTFNTNSVLITSTTDNAAFMSECRLSGNVTFDIGDGAAENDLCIDLNFADDTFVPKTPMIGKLIKEGAGTLMITAPSNSLTGGIEIKTGTLGISGTCASGMSVAEDAILRADTAAVEINGDLTFADSSGYAVTMLLAKTVVNGAVNGTGTTWVTTPVPAGDVKQVHLMHASEGITQRFKTELPGWVCSIVAGTDLYLKPMPAQILIY